MKSKHWSIYIIARNPRYAKNNCIKFYLLGACYYLYYLDMRTWKCYCCKFFLKCCLAFNHVYLNANLIVWLYLDDEIIVWHVVSLSSLKCVSIIHLMFELHMWYIIVFGRQRVQFSCIITIHSLSVRRKHLKSLVTLWTTVIIAAAYYMNAGTGPVYTVLLFTSKCIFSLWSCACLTPLEHDLC